MSADHTAPSSGKTAVLLGATGAVGKETLDELLSTSHFSQVHSFGRRPSGQTHAKLTEHNVDFEKLANGDATEADKLRNVRADAVLIALGTTRGDAGSAQKFERIDREYVIAAAKAARNEAVEGQRVAYISSTGANAKAPFLYMKSKGLTELGIASSGYPSSYLFRPGFLYGANREKPRALEKVYGIFTHHILSRVSGNAEIHVPLLAKAFVATAAKGDEWLKSNAAGKPLDGAEKGATMIDNADAVKLAKAEQQ